MIMDIPNNKTFKINNLDELTKTVQQILEISVYKIWLFYGDLGAGKTTMIKQLCLELGVDTLVSSPTYALINEYKTTSGNIIAHMDLYRLKTDDEAFEIGIEEYLYSGNYCFVEWPQVIENSIEEAHHIIRLSEDMDGSRTIVFE